MQNKPSADFVILSMKIARDNEIGPLAAEQMFANLHGILRTVKKGMESVVEQEWVTFEIAHIHQNIFFLVVVPRLLRDFVEAQIYAQYPTVEIQEVMDYVQFRNYKSVCVAELGFVKHDIFPIHTYEEFEDKMARQAIDPLSSILENVKKSALDIHENISIQFLFKPIDTKSWQPKVIESLHRFQKGKNIFVLGDEKHLMVDKNTLQQFFLNPVSSLYHVVSKDISLDSLQRKKTSTEDTVDPQSTLQKSVEEALIRKSSRVGFRVSIRIAFWSDREYSKESLEQKVLSVAHSFRQFNTSYFNGFQSHISHDIKHFALFKTRRFTQNHQMLLNTTECASLFHLPNQYVKTPNIVWVTSKKLEPPVELPTFDNTQEGDVTILGKTNFRGLERVFGIKTDDRRRHVYVIGKTGMGKSTLLENMIFSDILAGRGVGVVDPHGELADSALSFVPEYRKDDVIVVDPSDVDYPVAINMLEDVSSSEARSLISSGLVGIFKKMFETSWGPRLEYVLRNTILALLEAPNTNMMGIMRILVDTEYRKLILSHVTDPVVLSFWNQEFAQYNPRNVAEIISPIQNKVGQFLSSPIIRNIVGQTKTTINIREAMDNQKILIVNLSKGKIGEDNSALLGSMLITRFQIDAMARANIEAKDRKDFFLYVDEFQNFATDSFATILSEARKYKLSLTMANQYIAQMSDTVREAVFGNVGTIVTFQTGYTDAEFFQTQLGDTLLPDDITSLEKYTTYMRLLIGGMPSKPFSARTLPPPDIESSLEHRQYLLNISRHKYSGNREKVEAEIHAWSRSQLVSSNEKSSQVVVEKKKSPPQVSIDSLEVGQMVKANVIGITDYGLFLSYQGIEGLLHVNKIPDGQRKILKEAKKGDLLEVIILEKKGEKLAYSLISQEEAEAKKAKVDEVGEGLKVIEE